MGISGVSGGSDLVHQFNVALQYHLLTQSGLVLATMKRINHGADDPAGLVGAEALSAELTALEEASNNAARAADVVHVADSSLDQIGSLLNTIEGDVVAMAGGGLSDEEIAAKQMEIDAALEGINRIGQTTSYGGQKLLDGRTLTFNISPEVGSTVSLSMPNVNTGALGGEAGMLLDLASDGSASSTGDLEKAQQIVRGARSQVLQARAQAGAFEKYAISTSEQVFDMAQVSLSEAYSQIMDADVAAESSRMVRSQILVQSSLATLMQNNRQHGWLMGLGFATMQ